MKSNHVRPGALRRPGRLATRRTRKRSLACESLESRILLSTWYVATTGTNATGGTFGTQSNPWQTITYALAHIQAGDTVEIHAGTYREQFTLPYFTSTATTTIETDGSGPVIVDGADVFTGTWSLYTAVKPTAGGTVYSAAYSGKSPQEVINNGTWLQEIGYESTVYSDTADGEGSNPQRVPYGSNSVTSMVPDSFYFVPTSGQTSGGTLYIDLPTGTSPSSDVEISDRDSWVEDYTGSNRAHNDVINGLTFEYTNGGQDSTSSSPFAPAGMRLGTNSVLENCTLLYADFNDVAIASGDTVENCTIDYSGCVGLTAGGSTSGWIVADNTIDYNNYRHFSNEWESGGIKLIATGSGGYEEGSVYGNSIVGNFAPGIWSDSNTENTASAELLIYDNYVADNVPVPQDYFSSDYTVGEAGIKIEVSTYVRVFNNIVVGNYPNGIYISASQNTDVYNNTVVGNSGEAAIWAGGTPRTISKTGVNEPLQYVNIENNIIYDNTATYDLDIQANDVSGSTVYADDNYSNYNLIYRFGEPLQFSTGAYGGGATITTLSAWTSATGGDDANSITSDPELLNPGNNEYELGANSPAIGAGATLALNGDGSTTNQTDYTGAVRTSPFDIGAYKFVSGAPNGYTDPTASLDPNAWVDDTLPTGAVIATAKAGGVNGVWNWFSSASSPNEPITVPAPASKSGDLSVMPALYFFSGETALSFESASQTMSVTPTENLYAWVYLNPTNPAAEVMIQWKSGSTWYRAYWGANDITSFTSIESDDTGGTTTYAGSLPATGGWVQLEISASAVGLNTSTQVSGLSLDTYGGQAAWDDIGVMPPQTVGSIKVTPASATVDETATQTFTATAYDQNGNVLATQPTFTWSLGNGSYGGINSATGVYSAPATSGSATVIATADSVSGTATVSIVAATVANQYLFYYGSSKFDGSATSPSSTDQNAIATDKSALVSGSTATTATFSNVSSYADGINGILIDFANLKPGITFSASDFAFKVGNTSNASSWSSGPAPTAVATWTGSDGDTFADIVWANNAIQDEWLQVTVLADADTHLAGNFVFYFGNEIGATGTTVNNGVLQVNTTDVSETQQNETGFSSAAITNLYDFNRDGSVNTTDVSICQQNETGFGGLELITVGSSGGGAVLAGSSSPAAAQSSVSTTTSTASNTSSNDAKSVVSKLLKQGNDPLHRAK